MGGQSPRNHTNPILQSSPAAIDKIQHHKTEVCPVSVLSRDLTAPSEGPNCVSQMSTLARSQCSCSQTTYTFFFFFFFLLFQQNTGGLLAIFCFLPSTVVTRCLTEVHGCLFPSKSRERISSEWAEAMLCVLSKGGCKVQSTLKEEWTEERLENCK